MVAAGGVERLLGVMRHLLTVGNSDDVTTTRMVASGCLLNLCNTHGKDDGNAV